MKTLARIALAALLILVAVVPVACSSKGPQFLYQTNAAAKAAVSAPAPAFPNASFLVFSDAHLYSPSLGVTGSAFETYINEDRKLLADSTAIMDSLVDSISKQTADFVLVPGDLTKDGEKVDHELMASYLAKIEATGKKVYVVPGNHDILNPEAYSYSGDTKTRVDNITPEQFAQIYSAYGYGEALYRDGGSLSYVAEPVPGLWLLALDACRYRENKESAVTGGKFSPDTLKWIEARLLEASQKGKAVIVMMHHNVLEHYKGELKYFPDYIVDDNQAVAKLFAMYNVRFVFTGHYHAQDITMQTYATEGKVLYDVETGSLVTFPNPWRTVQLSASRVSISTSNITSIAGHTTDFPQYSHDYIEAGIANIAVEQLEKYKVSAEGAKKLSVQIAAAFEAHYAGDEKLPAGQPELSSKGSGFMGWVVVLIRKGMITGLWHDLPPADNNLVVELGGN